MRPCRFSARNRFNARCSSRPPASVAAARAGAAWSANRTRLERRAEVHAGGLDRGDVGALSQSVSRGVDSTASVLVRHPAVVPRLPPSAIACSPTCSRSAADSQRPAARPRWDVAWIARTPPTISATDPSRRLTRCCRHGHSLCQWPAIGRRHAQADCRDGLSGLKETGVLLESSDFEINLPGSRACSPAFPSQTAR